MGECVWWTGITAGVVLQEVLSLGARHWVTAKVCGASKSKTPIPCMNRFNTFHQDVYIYIYILYIYLYIYIISIHSTWVHITQGQNIYEIVEFVKLLMVQVSQMHPGGTEASGELSVTGGEGADHPGIGGHVAWNPGKPVYVGQKLYEKGWAHVKPNHWYNSYQFCSIVKVPTILLVLLR